MILEKYYYSPFRIYCKEHHNYTECPDEDICPNAFCDTCQIDYMSLDELGDNHYCTPSTCKMFGAFLND